MFTLRMAIHERLKEIGEERRALGDERRELMNRLQRLEEATTGIDTSSVIGSLTETVGALKDLVPSVPPSVVIEEIIRKQAEAVGQVEAPTEAPKTPVEEAAQEAIIRKPIVKRGKYSTKEVGGFIVNYLRENGGEASNKEIESYLLQEYGIQQNSFSNYLWTIRNVNKSIQKGRQSHTILAEKAAEAI